MFAPPVSGGSWPRNAVTPAIAVLALVLLPGPARAVPLCSDAAKWERCARTHDESGKLLAVPKSCATLSPGLKYRSNADEVGLQAAAPDTAVAGQLADPAVLARAQLLAARQVLDANVLDASMGRPVGTLGRSDFADPRIQTKLNNLPSSVVPIWQNQSRVMQVQPGTPLPPGDSDLPGTGAMVLDVGRGCARPALPGDWKPNQQGALDILMNPAGFPEVGEIVMRRDGKYKVCGFTLIHPGWGLTALHCVARQEGGKAVVDALNKDGKDRRAFFLLPHAGRAQDKLPACLSSVPSADCPARIVNVKDIRPADETWVGPLPKVDLALLQLDFTSSQGTRFVVPDFQADASGAVTVAGFGASNVETYQSGYGLLVGWHKGGSVDAKGWRYLWSRSDDPDGTTQCLGDSGSAVFRGRYFGRSSEASARKLFAVTSSVTYPSQLDQEATNKKCMAATASTASVVVAGYKDWICRHAPAVQGC